MPNNSIVVQRSAATKKRAKTVAQEIQRAAKDMKMSFFDLCELLAEVRREEYYLDYGFPAFPDWVEQGEHDLDMKARQAFYLANIGDKSKQLGITRKELEAAKPSKLKEIFTLDAEEHGKEIKRLVGEAAGASLDEIKKKVAKLHSDSGHEPTTFRNFKLTESQAEIVDEALDEAKAQHGDTVNEEGEPVEISDSKALEDVCADFLSHGGVVEEEK